MSPWWALPVAGALVGLVPVVLAARAVAEEATALRRAVARYRALRPAVAELAADAEAVRAVTRRLRRG